MKHQQEEERWLRCKKLLDWLSLSVQYARLEGTHVRESFNQFDTGRRGFIDAEDLLRGMAKLHQPLTQEEAHDLIRFGFGSKKS